MFKDKILKKAQSFVCQIFEKAQDVAHQGGFENVRIYRKKTKGNEDFRQFITGRSCRGDEDKQKKTSVDRSQ
jgi:hypothetical protein